MTIEDLLRTAAHEVAGGVDAPDVDPSAIRTRARRARLRQGGVALGAVAAVALVVGLAVQVTGAPPERPDPARPPEAVRSAPVWADGAGIHVGRKSYAPGGGVPVETLAVVARGAVYADTRGQVWFQPWAGTPTRIGQAVPWTLSAGAAGDTAAWFERGGGDMTLVVFDTREMSETARVEAAGEPIGTSRVNGDRTVNAGPFSYVGDQEVVYETAEEVSVQWRFDLSSGEHTVLREDASVHDGSTAADHYVLDFAPGVEVRSPPSDQDPATPYERTLTFTDEEGDFLSAVSGAEPSGLLSPDGRRFVGVFPTGRITTYVGVVDVETGVVTRLTDESRLYPLVAWGAGDALMVRRFEVLRGPEVDELLVCDAEAASCRVQPSSGEPVLPNG